MQEFTQCTKYMEVLRVVKLKKSLKRVLEKLKTNMQLFCNFCVIFRFFSFSVQHFFFVVFFC